MADTIQDAKSSRFSQIAPAIASALLAIVVFAVTLGGTYVYDDFDVFELDARLREPALWGQYWTESYNGGVDNLYRPLVSMTYAVQWWLHGADQSDAWKFHLVNLLLHAGASALVAELARRLGGARLAWIVGPLFAAHPVHVEAVANIVGRAELMCTASVVGALIFFLRPMTTGRAIAIAACFLIALLSKEQGMLTPLLLLFLAPARNAAGLLAGPAEAARGEGASRRAMLLLVILLTWTLAAYIVFRESILKFWWDRGFLDWTINPLVRPDADRLLMPVILLGRYVTLLFAPIRLSPDYGATVIGWTANTRDPYFWIGMFAVAIWIAWSLVALSRRSWVTFFALLSLAATYGLISNSIILIGTNFAERLLYLPSVFFLLLIAMLLVRIPRAVLFPVLAILLILGSLRSFTYAKRWNDRLSFYQINLREQPLSIRLSLLLTSEYVARGELEKARQSAARASEQLPEYWEVWVSRAVVAMRQREFDAAQQYLDRAAQQRGAPLGRITGFMKRLSEQREAN